MNDTEMRKIEIPAADTAALVFFGLLVMGWAFQNQADALHAVILALATSLMFWAPLRAMDYLHHRRLRRNDLFFWLNAESRRRDFRLGAGLRGRADEAVYAPGAEQLTPK